MDCYQVDESEPAKMTTEERTRLLVPWGGGLAFWCPACQDEHMVLVPGYDRGRPPQEIWTWNGSWDKPTFRASILVKHGHYLKPDSQCWCTYEQRFHEPAPDNAHCYLCHSFVTDGLIQFLGDCSHSLANQTVPLQPHEWSEWVFEEYEKQKASGAK